jgi:archaellum component FlaD/FlaE
MNIVEQIQMKAGLAEEPEAELVQEMDEEEEMVEEQEIVEDLPDDEEQEEDQEATTLEQEIDEEEVADEEDDQKASEPTYGKMSLLRQLLHSGSSLKGPRRRSSLMKTRPLTGTV